MGHRLHINNQSSYRTSISKLTSIYILVSFYEQANSILASSFHHTDNQYTSSTAHYTLELMVCRWNNHRENDDMINTYSNFDCASYLPPICQITSCAPKTRKFIFLSENKASKFTATKIKSDYSTVLSHPRTLERLTVLIQKAV